MKPDFESAVVRSTFRDESLPETLRRLAAFIEENNLDAIDSSSSVIIECSYDDNGYWYSGIESYYFNSKKLVNMVKKKKEK